MGTAASPRPTPITPYFDGDDLVVAFGETSPFGAAELESAGSGLLTFDPAAPDRLIELRIGEPDDAEGTLAVVAGPEATQQLRAMWWAGEVGEAIVPEPSPRLADLGRLALVSWLEEWTPLEIPGQALWLDVGTQAQVTGHPLLAMRSLTASADYLVRVAQRGQEMDLPDPVRHGIADALTAAVRALQGGHPLSSRLAGLADQWTTAPADHRGDWDDRLQDLVDGELAAISGVDPDLGALFSVDWALVPARVLHPGEGQGHLTRSEHGMRITVTPARWPDTAKTLGLQARLVDPDSGVPLAVAPLLWVADGGLFAAEFPFDRWPDVDPEVLASGVPEVYAEAVDGTRPAPRVGSARESARVWRESVRALTHRRRSRACELALGVPLPQEMRAADMMVTVAASDAETIGGASTAAALRAWRNPRSSGEVDPAWPTGLMAPEAIGVARPTLAEMVEVVAPELFALASR